MILDFDQIKDILDNKPNKAIIEYGKEAHKLLSAVVLGDEYTSELQHSKYFEDDALYEERKKSISNIDLFGRILQRENMVYEARGGSIVYNEENKEKVEKLEKTISNIRLGLSLRSWIKEICSRIYEVDPMGVVFMEKSEDGKETYPTYKSIAAVYDYLPKGRNLEYIVLTVPSDDGEQFRVVDDKYDYIIKKSIEKVDKGEKVMYEIISRISHTFGITPAIIASDVIDFQNVKQFKSKLWQIVQLGLKYMEDRSIRDLSKKFHGFPKAVMPMVSCGACKGTGHISGETCTNCNGSGWTTIKKVSDRIDLPLNILEENIGFDIRKILAYATPDITTWNKQDDSLNDLEVLMSDCYWGTDYRRFTSGQYMEDGVDETATKTMVNLQPVYSRLERTAEWAEKTEEMIINFVGSQVVGKEFQANVIYGRDYILESTHELLLQYQSAKSKGAPLYELNDIFERYLMSKHQNSPKEMVVAMKLMKLEPLIHYTAKEAKEMGVPEEILSQKIYFADWYNSIKKDYIFVTPIDKLKQELLTYLKDYELQKEGSSPKET